MFHIILAMLFLIKVIIYVFAYFQTYPQVLGLGLEPFCPWPRSNLSSATRSLASDSFKIRGLEGSVLDSTSAVEYKKMK